MSDFTPTTTRASAPSVTRTRLRLAAMTAVTVLTLVGTIAVVDSPVEAASRTFTGSNPTRLRDTRKRRALGDGKVMGVDVGTTNTVVLNLTAVNPSGPGHLTAYPCGTRRPTASVLNFHEAVTSNLTIVKPDSRGKVCIFARVGGGGQVDLVVDKFGVIGGSVFKGNVADRRFDTRRSGGKIRAGETRRITGIQPHESLVVNLTVAQPGAAGWLAAYPCAEGYKGTASLNYSKNETRAALAVVRADSLGRVCLRSSKSTHVIADVMGTFKSSQAADVISPARVMDTRKGLAGRYGQSFRLDFDSIKPERGARLRGRRRAVMLNVAAVAPKSDGHVVVWPCSKRRPNTSVVNFSRARYATSNAVVVQPDSAGKVCIWSSAPTHLVVDIGGFLNASAPGSSASYQPRTDCRRGSLSFINNERRRAGRRELRWDERQFKFACAWAHRMATDEYLHHWGWGQPYPFGGENVAVGPNVAWLENAWLESSGHRANIIGPNYVGTALAYVSNTVRGRRVVWGVNQFNN